MIGDKSISLIITLIVVGHSATLLANGKVLVAGAISSPDV
jgi:hypothetical protein